MRRRTIADVDRQIGRSRMRVLNERSRGNPEGELVEQHVLDRQLDERIELMKKEGTW